MPPVSSAAVSTTPKFVHDTIIVVMRVRELNVYVSCLPLFMHMIDWALILALDSAGSNIAARMAMIAMTTKSSIKRERPECSYTRSTTGPAGKSATIQMSLHRHILG